ncbi:uncharacterized protein METZ01_LOCUS283895 [marine metagenome]|uniref:Uncharacterized protein n=1 Tax=marine metagenome TaxID=408172 RepID=A0A382L813_9ZZZZ
MKKLFVVLFLIFNSLKVQAIEPLKNYSLENILENDEINYKILEGCISLYMAVTELTRERYPDLGDQFSEMTETLNPYGIISLSKMQGQPYNEAKNIFFNNVSNLKDQYIDEMNKNGKLNGSYFKGSFLGDDLSFCYEVTRYLQLAIMESLGE